MSYLPLEIPEDLKEKIATFAFGVASDRDMQKRIKNTVHICLENAMLLAEVNRLRGQLGIELLPVIDPSTGKAYVNK